MREDYGKLFFNILDYTGTRHAACSPTPTSTAIRRLIDEHRDRREGEIVTETGEEDPAEEADEPTPIETVPSPSLPPDDEPTREPRKYYVDGGGGRDRRTIWSTNSTPTASS